MSISHEISPNRSTVPDCRISSESSDDVEKEFITLVLALSVMGDYRRRKSGPVSSLLLMITEFTKTLK